MKKPELGYNREQSFIEFETTEGKMRIGKEDSRIFVEVLGNKFYLTDSDGSSSLGTAPTPVARTYSPIVGANDVNTNIDILDAAIGGDPIPYARTVGAISTGQSVNDNINDLDSIIGPDFSPVTRTVGQLSVATHIMGNLDALDTAIGADMTPLTRTTGQLAVASSVYANIDALDSVIGADNQMPVSSLDVTRNQTIYQNLRALDTNKSVRTIKKTIGAGGAYAQGTITVSGTPVDGQTIEIGTMEFTFVALRAQAGEITISADNPTQVTNIVDAITADIPLEVSAVDGAGDTVVVTSVTLGTAGNAIMFIEAATGIAVNGTGTLGATTLGVNAISADFNFSIAANQTENVVNLGAIVPAKARIVDAFVFTDAVFTGAVSLAADLGTSSGGDELIASGTIYATNAIRAAANAGAFIATPSASAQNIYLNATPGANWNLVTAGRVSVYITFIDVTNL